MQKAKHRTKALPVPAQPQNGNGFHQNAAGLPDDLPENDPIAQIAGSYKDDPFWDEFIQHMKDFRRQELERDLKNLENEP